DRWRLSPARSGRVAVSQLQSLMLVGDSPTEADQNIRELTERTVDHDHQAPHDACAEPSCQRLGLKQHSSSRNLGWWLSVGARSALLMLEPVARASSKMARIQIS